jgi:lipopolysaccharide transport system ATP-binding protein
MRTYVNLENVFVDFPVYSNTSRSLKKRIFDSTIFKRVSELDDSHVAVNALRGLNIHFTEGERIGIVGKNGAGKSTLLRVLNGIYAPSSGKITIEGKLNALVDIGLGLDAEATGRENIILQGLLLRVPLEEIKSKEYEIVEFSELGEFIDLPISSYSTGMLLRLAFSIYTATAPNILVMDEWLSVGDLSFQKKAENRLTNMIENCEIVIMASHSEPLIKKMATRVIWMQDGKIIGDGKPEEICKAYFKE